MLFGRYRHGGPLGRLALCAVVAVGLYGCSSPSRPTPSGTNPPPTTNPPANTNRAPVITAATVGPAWGIATLTAHAFSASATDPDGDPLAYSWSLGNGTSSAGSSATVTYTNSSTTTFQATLTVTDGRGGTATSTVDVTSVTLSGTWDGILIGAPVAVTLTQASGGIVTGTWDLASFGIFGEVGPTGEPGRVRADGSFDLRFKVRVGAFIDFFFRGTVDPTGRRLTGTLHSSGFTGDPMILDKR